MAMYRLYILRPTGGLIQRREIEADEDEDALAQVERRSDQLVTELWLGGRLVRKWPAEEA